jgi:hypothetical protein
VGLRAGLDAVTKREIFAPVGNRIPSPVTESEQVVHIVTSLTYLNG